MADFNLSELVAIQEKLIKLRYAELNVLLEELPPLVVSFAALQALKGTTAYQRVERLLNSVLDKLEAAAMPEPVKADDRKSTKTKPRYPRVEDDVWATWTDEQRETYKATGKRPAQTSEAKDKNETDGA